MGFLSEKPSHSIASSTGQQPRDLVMGAYVQSVGAAVQITRPTTELPNQPVRSELAAWLMRGGLRAA